MTIDAAHGESRLFRPSVSFEVNKHCNLRCAGCDHVSPWYEGKHNAAVDGFIKDFTALTQVMEIDELCFSGGETLLHPGLLDFFEESRRRGFSAGISLVTNGTLLHRAPKRMWELIDLVYISQYPGVSWKMDEAEVRAIATEHHVVVLIEQLRSFKIMLLNDEVKNSELTDSVFRGCWAAEFCHTVDRGRYFKCSRAHNLSERMKMIGKDVENLAEDGIPLHGNASLRQDLEAYLAGMSPLKACRYCLGSHGRERPHVQLKTKAEIAAEKRADHGDVMALLDPEISLAEVKRPAPAKPGWWRFENPEIHMSVQTKDRGAAQLAGPPRTIFYDEE